jgi:dTMP kinase
VARGKFITVEGIEGVGKSTHCAYIVDFLSRTGRDVISTREPGGTELGEGIRELLLNRSLPPMVPVTELLLMFAARAEHIHKVIRPAVESGRWVVCDRFTDATYAYQGGGRGVDTKAIAALEALAQRKFRPDLTVLLDVPVEMALSRATARGDAADRFELEDVAFFERVRRRYLENAANEPDRVAVVDGARTIAQVRTDIQRIIVEVVG